MAQVITISNQKGGVAKTTTCLSLGACLAELGHRVLVVDLDSQANLTMAAGLDPEALRWTVVDLLKEKGEALLEIKEGVIQLTLVKGLSILPADVRLVNIERALYEQENYEKLLAQALAPWQSEYDYIFVDCLPSLGALTLMALTAAHSVLVPVQCEYYAARGLKSLLDIITAVRERTNPNLAYYLVATLYDQRNKICQQVLELLQANFPNHLLNTIIGVDTRLRECPATGEPIILYAPRTRASQQYRRLAQEFRERMKKQGV